MSVIIRLQNLPWNANALDIRRYFGGLSIPDGGVHIIGGEYGDAFIAFSTDEDARQAMLKDNGRINGLPIKLLLSSKTEMQNVIASAKGGAPASQPMPNPPKVGGYFDRLSAPPATAGGMPQFGDGSMAGVGSGGAAVPGPRGYPGDEFRDGHLQPATYGRMPGDSRTVVNGFQPAVSQPVTMRPSDRMPPLAPPSSTDNQAAPYRAPADVAAPGYRSDFGQSLGNAPGAAWGSAIRGHTGNLPPTSDFGRPSELPVADSRGAAYGRDVGRFGDDPLGPARGYGGDSRGRDYPLPSTGRDFARMDPVRDLDRMEDRRFLAERDFDRGDPARAYFGRDDPRDMRAGRDFPPPIGARDFPPPGPADRWLDVRGGVDDFRGGPGPLPPRNDIPRDPMDRGRDRYDYPPEPPRFGGAYGSGIGAGAVVGPGYGGLPFREPGRPDILPPPVVAPSSWSSGDPRDMDRAGPPGGPQWFREPPLPGPPAPPPVNDLTIHISNLPHNFNYRHVRRFLQNSIIPHNGLKLVNDRSGRRTGTAYVRFADVRSLTAALERDGTMAEDCKVRIERCDPREFECAVDDAPPMPDRSRSPLNRKSMKDSSSSDGFYFVIKKLPKKVDKSDLKKFLKNFKIASEGGPFLEIAYGGNLTGNALVEIEKVKDASAVLKELHHSTFNGSRVDVICINKSEFDERTKRARQAEQDGGKEKDTKTSRVSSSAGGKDKEDKQEVKSKEVERSSSSETRRCVVLRGCPFSTNSALLREFFSGLQIAPKGIHIVFNHESRAAGIAYVEFVTADDQRKALEKDRKYLGHRYVEVRAISRSAMIEEYRTSQRSAGGQPMDEFDEEEVKSSGRGGGHSSGSGSNVNTTLCMQNLHSDTQLEDILDFFVGYHPIVDSIKLQYKDGQPTGDGLVVFPSVQEAESAMRSKNRNLLLGKPVLLSYWSKS